MGRQTRLPLAMLAALFSTSIGQAVYYYPRLPSVVVSHTGPDGPDGWMSKGAYLAVMLGMEFALVLLIAVMPIAVGRRRIDRLTIPNATYWLAPQRRESTFQTLSAQLLWLAVILQAANVLIWQHTLEDNLDVEHLVPVSFIGLIGMTFAASIVWVWRFTRSFALPP